MNNNNTMYKEIEGLYATGTCCRGCLERIHHIEKNKELNVEEIDYIVKVIIMWIKNEMNEYKLYL